MPLDVFIYIGQAVFERKSVFSLLLGTGVWTQVLLLTGRRGQVPERSSQQLVTHVSAQQSVLLLGSLYEEEAGQVLYFLPFHIRTELPLSQVLLHCRTRLLRKNLTWYIVSRLCCVENQLPRVLQVSVSD